MIITVYSLTNGALPEELMQEDRPVWLPEDRRDAGEMPADARFDRRLNGLPGAPGETVSVFRRILWWICFWLGLGPGKNTVSRVRQESRSLAEELLEQNEACVAAADPARLEMFLRALRRRGFVVRRSRVGPIRPGEKIFLSQRKDHCGGCSHNCLLKNPGCGVGQDKARRGI